MCHSRQKLKTKKSKSTATSLKQYHPYSMPHLINCIHPAAIIQYALTDPGSLTSAKVLQLQSSIGNKAVRRLLTEIPHLPAARPVAQSHILSKFSINPQGDIYKQEMDKKNTYSSLEKEHSYIQAQGDVVFGAGHYTPYTIARKKLMAYEMRHVTQQNGNPTIQKKIEVNPGLNLDTMGYTTSKSGNVYTCPRIVKASIWNELFTSLLNSPRTFKLKGSTNTEVNKNFKKHMAARAGIVRFAAKKKYRFGAGSAFKMNPTYWNVTSSGWSLKPGADRRKAIADLNVNPAKYAIACFAATMLTMEGGSNSTLTRDIGVGNSDWIPGDWGYITNTAFPGFPVGQEGENIIYTGKNKFWGHIQKLNTYKTLTEWYNKVKSWHGSASIESHRDYPKAGLE